MPIQPLPPPRDTQTRTNIRCMRDALRCSERLLLEAIAIVASLACIRMLMYTTESPLDFRKALVFCGLYVALGLAFKLCNFEFSDKIAHISGIELGLKMFRAI